MQLLINVRFILHSEDAFSADALEVASALVYFNLDIGSLSMKICRK